MKTTEREAKGKWCPMVRHEGDNGGVFNRGMLERDPVNKGLSGNTDYLCNCLGSGCMMWRWARGPQLEKCVSINPDQVYKLLGETRPKILAGDTSDAGLEAYRQQIDEYMEAAKSNPKVREFFAKAGDGWTQEIQPIYDDEEAILYARYTRDTDPGDKGYCGLAGGHGEMV